MHTFEVNESRWLTGDVLAASKDKISSSLREPETGLQCCLGFGMRACGYSAKDITDQALPTSVARERKPAKTSLESALLKIQYPAAKLNDDKEISNETRKLELVALFKAQKVKLTFTGNPKLALAHMRRKLAPKKAKKAVKK